MTKQDRTMEKIKALLRKADPARNDNEHEREAALKAANQMLLKHGLAMADLGDVDGTTQPGREFEHDAYFTTDGSGDEWRGTLLNVLAGIYFCKCYGEPRADGTRKLYLVGRADYVTMCKTMYEFVAPQLEHEQDLALLKITRTTSPHQQQQARHARRYALASAARVGLSQDEIAELSQDELADVGATRHAELVGEGGSEIALLDIMYVCDVSLNFAKKVRAFVKRGDIAGEPIKDLGVWRRSFYSGAVSRVGSRLRKLVNIEVEDLGEAGSALVRNEERDLNEFLDSLNLGLQSRRSNRKADAAGLVAGDAAGRRADLSVGRKVTSNLGTRQIGA